MRSLLPFALLAAVAAAQDAPPATTPPAGGTAQPVMQPPEPGRFKPLFQRFRTEHASLSPDGRHLAYSVREEESVFVVVIDLDHPTTVKAQVKVVDDRAATPMMAVNQREKTPGRVLWLRWTTPHRVVVETNEVQARHDAAESTWISSVGSVLGFDADGGNARKLASPEDIVELLPPSDARTIRPLLATVLTPITRPDQPTAEEPAAAEDDDGIALPGEENEEDPAESASATADTSLTSARPRGLAIFALDAQRAGNVTLVSHGTDRDNKLRSLGFYSLETRTGKLTNLKDTLVRTTQATLMDRQGRPRVAVSNSMVAKFPFRYEYFGPEGKGRGTPLDESVGLTGFSVSPANYFGERSVPLGFDEDPNILYYASNIGRDTYGLYSLDLTTGKRGSLTLENPKYDLIAPPGDSYPDPGTLVFDRYTHKLAGVRFQASQRTAVWLRPEWQAVQAALEKALPVRSVDLLDWDEAGRRFLFSTEGPADPGAFHLFDRETKQIQEYARRAPWIDANHTHTTLPFGFATDDGTRLTGFITVPSQPRMKPVPMIVLCPEQPWASVAPGFQREVHALAGMGFAVVQYNGRGAWGLGRKQREGVTAGYDATQVEDLATTVNALTQRFQVNPKRIALLGRGHGGFIALRAVQAFPDLFRCAIALEPPVNLGSWLASQRWSEDDVLPQLTRAWLGDEARLKAAPLASQPEAVTKPILILSYPGIDGAPRRPVYLAARRFAEDVRRHGATAEFDELPTDYVQGLPAARAAVFDRIEAFLNEHIYDYKVKLHDIQVLPDRKP